MKAERPRIANEADRMVRNDGVRKRGCMVNTPHPTALIVAYDASILLRIVLVTHITYHGAVKALQSRITVKSEVITTKSRCPDDEDDAQMVEFISEFPNFFAVVHANVETVLN